MPFGTVKHQDFVVRGWCIVGWYRPAARYAFLVLQAQCMVQFSSHAGAWEALEVLGMF